MNASDAGSAGAVGEGNGRTCLNCGHRREVHGGYRARVGWRCNFDGGDCDCLGFQAAPSPSVGPGRES